MGSPVLGTAHFIMTVLLHQRELIIKTENLWTGRGEAGSNICGIRR